MSDSSPTSSQYDLLINGYCHDLEKQFNIKIPDYLVEIILEYYVKYMIFGIGNWGNGELGVGDSRECSKKWVRLGEMEQLLSDTSHLYINERSIMIISRDNNVYAAGYNCYARLGLTQNNPSSVSRVSKFTLIPNMSSSSYIILSRSLGNATHTFIYLADHHQLFANGGNEYGQRGNGDTPKYEPTILSLVQSFCDNARITSIACTEKNSYFLMDTGDLFAAGKAHGNRPKVINKDIKTIAGGGEYMLMIDKQSSLLILGNMGDWDNHIDKYTTFFNEKKIKINNMSAGYKHAAVLTESGDAYTFGQQGYGQCAQGSTRSWLNEPHKIEKDIYGKEIEPIMDISCGCRHTIFVTSESNQLYTSGENSSNQCSKVIKNSTLYSPWLLDREKEEIGIANDDLIIRVYATMNATIIIIDPFKKIQIK